MRIVDVTTYYPPHIGGVEAYASSLHSAILKDGTSEVHVFTSGIDASSGTITRQGRLSIYRFRALEPVSGFAIAFWTNRAARRISTDGQRASADLVISHTRFYPASWRARSLANKLNARWLHIEHGGEPVASNSRIVRICARLIDRTLGRRTLRKADAVLAVSEAAATFVRSISGREALIAHRGIDIPEARWRPPASRTAPRVLYVGRLVAGKGVQDLINALRDTDAHLQLVGSGPALSDLREAARGASLTIEFIGQVPPEEVSGWMRQAHVLVNPSHSEGLPTTVMEAAALGMPVVATDVGGTSEVIKDGRTGLLVPPHDPGALRHAVQRLLSNPEYAQALGASARVHVRETFSWDLVVKVVQAALNPPGEPESRRAE